MSTNYYHGSLHIGKSPAGWCFLLRLHPHQGILSLDDWENRWTMSGSDPILDEYDRELSVDEMLSVITERHTRHKSWEREWQPIYLNESHFHLYNSSERGPNYLFRSKVTGSCVGHGPGTYDYIIGEFS